MNLPPSLCAAARGALTVLAGGAALLGLTGCYEVVPRPALEVDGARSAVLVVEHEAGREIYAVDLEEGWPRFSARGPVDLHAALFSCPVARLGLEAGPVPEEPIPLEVDPLPPPLAEARLDEGAGAWALDAARPPEVQDALLRLPLPEDGGCALRSARFESVETALPSDGHNLAAFAVTLADGRALVASREGFYYRVDIEGTVETLPRLIGPEPLAAHALEDGTVYVLDAQGGLHRGTVEAGFTLVHESPDAFAGAEFVAMTGDPRPGAEELFAVSPQTKLLRYDGARWTTLSTGAPSRLLLPKVLWRGPGRAVAPGFGDDGRGILLVDGDRTEVSSPPLGQVAVGVGLRAERLLVGTFSGEVYDYAEGRWQLQPDLDLRAYVHLFQPLDRGGVLVGGIRRQRGLSTEFGFGQYFDDLGACAAERLSNVAAEMTRVGEDGWLLVTVTSLVFEQAFDVAILREVAPPVDCSAVAVSR